MFENGTSTNEQDGYVPWFFGYVFNSYVEIWCFPLSSGYPPVRWMVFVNGKIPSFEMDENWGQPYDETETPIYVQL